MSPNARDMGHPFFCGGWGPMRGAGRISASDRCRQLCLARSSTCFKRSVNPVSEDRRSGGGDIRGRLDRFRGQSPIDTRDAPRRAIRCGRAGWRAQPNMADTIPRAGRRRQLQCRQSSVGPSSSATASARLMNATGELVNFASASYRLTTAAQDTDPVRAPSTCADWMAASS